jgi:hypothetical protein
VRAVLRRPLFLSLVVGTALPLFFFVALLLRLPNWMDPQYVIPIAGMILGNCLRADIVGIRTFYDSIRKSNRAYLRRLAVRRGARRSRPAVPARRLQRRARAHGRQHGDDRPGLAARHDDRRHPGRLRSGHGSPSATRSPS